IPPSDKFWTTGTWRFFIIIKQKMPEYMIFQSYTPTFILEPQNEGTLFWGEEISMRESLTGGYKVCDVFGIRCIPTRGKCPVYGVFTGGIAVCY
ncbi:MAG: hypothetical protein IKL04_05080, partial [Lachnospiraceae bacterium]|nr:hypothetical protein [Lachnospiraceae bacterium]